MNTLEPSPESPQEYIPREYLENLDIADVVQAYKDFLEELPLISRSEGLAKYRFSKIYSNRHRIFARRIGALKDLLWRVKDRNDPDTDENTWTPVIEHGLTYYVHQIRGDLADLKKSTRQIEILRCKVAEEVPVTYWDYGFHWDHALETYQPNTPERQEL